ncbi:hypothetical protein HZC30_04570 [Candidatus Woesearchaeota archaeon]|nr:hypothetical protein [Candidatus Woesearchaeota archaeon]
MKINKAFRFLQEPYILKERFWLVNIKEGDVFKISKKTFQCLQSINNSISVNDDDIINSLREMGAIVDD